MAFGVLSLAILGLIAVFTSGVKLSVQARNITVATELGKQAMERIRSNVTTIGFASIPTGTYVYDGRLGNPPAGAPLYPPAPYPTTKVNGQEYFLVVSGDEPVTDRIRDVRIDVYWDELGHITLETKFTP